MFLFALVALSHAAEIQVIADTPVSVEVDGRILPVRPGERGATATELAGGNHRVQVFDGGDRLLASATVGAGVAEQVRLEVRRGQLVELGRGPLVSAASAASCPEPLSAPGSFQLTGIEPGNVAVWVDGQAVRYGGGSFLAQGLAAGPHEVRVARGAATLYTGTMRVYPELVRRCMPTGVGLDCVHAESVVAFPPVATAGPAPLPPASAAPPAPPAPPAPVSERDYIGIVSAVKAANFSSDKLGVLGSAVKERWFTIEQMGVLLDQFAHSSDKLDAAKLLAPRVVDPQNAYKLDAHLSFSSDKEAVRKLFAGG